MIKRPYGWLKQKFKDPRDFKLAPPTFSPLSPLIDLRPLCPSISDYNQSTLGSCTAHAISYAIHFEMLRQQFLTPFQPSRLLVYYMERAKEGTINFDNGAEIRDGIKCVAAQGVTSEADWPYDVTKFKLRPPDQAFMNALTFNAFTQKEIFYQTVDQDPNHLKACLVAAHPFIFGFDVYESFESEEVAKTGIVPMPGLDEKMVGGHAVCAVGYDDSKQAFICANWWGEWGSGGYFYLPYKYVTNMDLANDFWLIHLVA